MLGSTDGERLGYGIDEPHRGAGGSAIIGTGRGEGSNCGLYGGVKRRLESLRDGDLSCRGRTCGEQIAMQRANRDQASGSPALGQERPSGNAQQLSLTGSGYALATSPSRKKQAHLHTPFHRRYIIHIAEPAFTCAWDHSSRTRRFPLY